MAGVGEYLRAGRSSSGISLEQISEDTRISVMQLEALENEAFERLPGGVFNVSFARQYAMAVGIDADEAAARLKAATSVTVPLPFSPGSSTKSPLLMRSAASRFASALWGAVDEYSGVLAGFVVAALLIGLGIFWYNQSLGSPGVIAQTTAQESRVEEVAFKAPTPPEAAIQLELRITDTVWVRALADGKPVLERILNPGESRPIEAEAQVYLSVGNAGGITLALNGETLPSFGGRGQVRRVRITPSGLTVLGGPGITNGTQPSARESAALEGPSLARVDP